MRITCFSIVCLLTFPVLAQEARDPWERLQRNDANQDGRVSREEFSGPSQFFQRADANGDGFITAEEARALRGRLGPGPRAGGGPLESAGPLVGRIDANRDEALSFDEWTDFFKSADENADGILQPGEWRAATRGEPLNDSAPAVGADAPRVKAKGLKTGHDVDLSQPKRTTVLIFGSHT